MHLEIWGRRHCFWEIRINHKELYWIWTKKKQRKIKKKVFLSMKVIYEKAIKVDKEFNTNVDEQQDYINHFKGQCEVNIKIKFRKS